MGLFFCQTWGFVIQVQKWPLLIFFLQLSWKSKFFFFFIIGFLARYNNCNCINTFDLISNCYNVIKPLLYRFTIVLVISLTICFQSSLDSYEEKASLKIKMVRKAYFAVQCCICIHFSDRKCVEDVFSLEIFFILFSFLRDCIKINNIR